MALPDGLRGSRPDVLHRGRLQIRDGRGGRCFMHCPPGYGPRPRDTGWYAAFGALTGSSDRRSLRGGRLPLPRRHLRSVGPLPAAGGVRLDAGARPDRRGDPRPRPRPAAALPRRARGRPAGTAEERPPGHTDGDPRRGHFLTFETPRAEALYKDSCTGGSSPTSAATASASASAATMLSRISRGPWSACAERGSPWWRPLLR